MISSFFGKTKPINYIILITFIFIFYWFVHFIVFDKTYGLEELVLQLVILAILSFGLFVLNFIVKRNKITGTHSFAILFFTMLLMVFPQTLIDNNAVLCTFFLFLTMRRLISVRSMKTIRLKIFDATLWIVTASIFYDWALIYLLVVFLAIYIYEPKNLKNWMAPLAGLFTVFMIMYCVLVLTGNTDFLQEHYRLEYTFDKAYFLNWLHSTKLVLYIIGISFVGFMSFLSVGKAGVGKVATLRLIAFLFFLGLVLEVLIATPGKYPIMVTFFPAAIFLAKYVESIKKANIKEIVLMLSIFIPFMVFFIGLIIR
ncbi:hypothetical protein FGM00_17635 [Aggregatimonas sangjinii]|uniref:Beta-carotene 15,15'-monooxygenase n=1 Tax=Aggregatimonas sangjinii TaxID=2583587 RepID=A0A5B7ST43_9FLAO|nr:DUF6427 family protein [Aggregatimonas sangjinii]QCX01846.1 hypothetical protein FGM00_17635 [Aggregatimonas sangjinii]